MQLPLISIIIPVYNVEPYIRACLDSVRSQTYTNLEIILIDDGSPDTCPSICDEYSLKDSRIIVIHQINQGLSGARNSGIQIAKGEYLSFVDSDDILQSDYIQKLFESLCINKCKVALCNNETFLDEVPSVFFQKSDYKILQLLDIFNIPNSMCAWGKLFHKSLFENTHFPVGKLHEDEFIVYKLLYNAKQIAYCNYPLYFYRTREGSIMQNRKQVFYTDFLEALLDNYSYFYSLNEIKICEQFLLRLTYLNTDFNKFCKLNKRSYKECPNISTLIYKLPKKKLSYRIKIKVFIKTTLIFIFKFH